MSWPAYAEYRESSAECVGKVPIHWDVVPVRAMVEERAEKNIDGENQNYLSLMANVGIIPYEEKGDVGNKKPDDLSRCKIVKKGDLVLNSMNFGIGSYGISPFDGVCSPVYVVLRPKPDKVYARYALRIFENKEFQRLAQSFGQGILAHRSAIGWDELKGLLVPLPPPNEQQQIRDFLDHETVRIDTLIEEQQRLIDLLQEKRQAVISHAVTKGLDPDVPMKDSGVEWLGKIPAHWKTMKFLRCVRIAEGQVDPADPAMELLTLIAPNHIESGTGTLRSRQSAAEQGAQSGKYLCYRGDVIYSKIRPSLRKACLADETCLCSADMYPLRPIYRIKNGFLLWIVLSDPFTHLAILESERVAMPKINRESLKEIRLPVPPLDEQERICEHIDTKFREMDDLTDQVRMAVNLLTERRSALISAAVTGKIDVRGWKPQDTPVEHDLPMAAEAEAQYG